MRLSNAPEQCFVIRGKTTAKVCSRPRGVVQSASLPFRLLSTRALQWSSWLVTSSNEGITSFEFQSKETIAVNNVSNLPSGSGLAALFSLS